MRLAAVATLAAGLLIAPPAVAASHATPEASQVVGHLAYLTKHHQVKVVQVSSSGATSHSKRIGPVTKAPANGSIAINSFVSSGDGDWIAWQEIATKHNGAPAKAKPVLVLRSLNPRHVYTFHTGNYPVGFALDRLVVFNGRHTSLVDVSPTPQFEQVPGNLYPLTTYDRGTVNVKTLTKPPGKRNTDQLRLTTFNGATRVLHNYVMSPKSARIPDLGFVSSDGEHLVVERGDHTDFGGIGPSSLTDEYRLSNHYARTSLGHYGTAKAAWRIGDVSFAGPADQPWALWERATRKGATSVVAVQRHSGWHRVLGHGIAVSGNSGGYVVTQAGRYVFDHDGLQFTRVPIGPAMLNHGKAASPLHIKGSQFAWVS
jgi:hypothetical protein